MVLKNPFAVLLLLALPLVAPAAEEKWETLPDGSLGQETSFRGVGDVVIPAYVRKPKGPGPFPVVVLLHGGKFSKAATLGLGRSAKSPVQDFLAAGWAVYSIDYRPQDKIVLDPTEIDDCLEAIKTLRKLPFVDAGRIALHGGSHGANLISRLVSRVQVRGAVLCAPAAMDLIEVKKAFGRGEKLVMILDRLVKDMEKRHGASAEEIEKDPKKYGYSSALTETAEVKCPLLIVNGKNDDNSPTSIIDLYAKKLRTAGKSVETYLPENGPHGFYYGRPDIPEWKEATKQAVAFISKCFKEEPAKKEPANPQPKEKTKYQYGSMDWVDPDRTETELLKYKTFRSKTINADVSFMVYLPPDYEQQKDKRYPVLYNLHASGGTPRRDGVEIVRRVDRAIRAGVLVPLIVVCPNGLRGATMYSDSKDGEYPVESVIVKDLIPHVDATYRTIADRKGLRSGGVLHGRLRSSAFRLQVSGNVRRGFDPGAAAAGAGAETAAADAGLVQAVPNRDGRRPGVLPDQRSLRPDPEERGQNPGPERHSHRHPRGKREVAGAALRGDAPAADEAYDPAPVPLPIEREIAQSRPGAGNDGRCRLDVLQLRLRLPGEAIGQQDAEVSDFAEVDRRAG